MTTRKLVLLFGGTGRLGRICRNALRHVDMGIAQVARGGVVTFDDQPLGTMDEIVRLDIDWVVIDASVDYSSTEAFILWEEKKRELIGCLRSNIRLSAYVCFSSGIVEFEPWQILDEFRRSYQIDKRNLERFVLELDVPSYCPRIFTLIGQETWNYGNVAWVQIAKEVIAAGVATIGFPDEQRSWVAESTIESQLKKFFSSNFSLGQGIVTPLDGIFTLRNIASIIASDYKKNLQIKSTPTERWLSVEYKSIRPHLADLSKLVFNLRGLAKEL